MNSSNIFKKLLLAALVVSLSGSAVLAMDDGNQNPLNQQKNVITQICAAWNRQQPEQPQDAQPQQVSDAYKTTVGIAQAPANTTEQTSRKLSREDDGSNEPGKKKARVDVAIPTASTTTELGQTPADAADQAQDVGFMDFDPNAGDNSAAAANQVTGGETPSQSRPPHKRSRIEISNPDETQAADEQEEPAQKKAKTEVGSSDTKTELIDNPSTVIEQVTEDGGAKILPSANFFEFFSDDSLLGTVFPAFVTPSDNVEAICSEVEKLVQLRYVCRRFKILLSDKNIRQILRNAGIDLNFVTSSVNSVDKNGFALLHRVIRPFYLSDRQIISIVKALIIIGANPNVQVNNPSSVFHNFTPLHFIANRDCHIFSFENTLEITQALLNAEADPNAQINNPGNEYNNWTPMHFAVDKANVSAVKALLVANADANANAKIDNPGTYYNTYTPLLFALSSSSCSEDSKKIIQMLLDAGADPNAQINNPGNAFHTWTTLHFAVRMKNINITEALLKKHANPNVQINNPGNAFHTWTPLHFAVRRKNINAMKALLKKHVNPNVQINNPAGVFHTRTPLHFAVQNVDTAAIKILLNAGARVPESLLPQLAELGFTQIPEKQIDRGK